MAVLVNARFLSRRVTGVERYAREITARLGEDVQLLRPPVEGPLAGHLWEQVALPAQLSDADLLWSPANTGPIALRRHVVTIHDVSPLDHPEWFHPRFAAWYRLLLPRLARRARRVLTVSEFSRRRIVARLGVDARRVVVVPCGVGPPFGEAAGAAIDARLGALGLARDRYVLSVGTVEPRKNLAWLLRAWTALVQAAPDLALVIVGTSGPQFAALSPDALPRGVRLLGEADEASLACLYAGARAVVLPSRYEGFGLPALEAMASGAPVIASDAGALPETTGGAALLVPTDDDAALADAIARVAQSPALAEALRAGGRARAATFTWDRSARAIAGVLAEEHARRFRKYASGFPVA